MKKIFALFAVAIINFAFVGAAYASESSAYSIIPEGTYGTVVEIKPDGSIIKTPIPPYVNWLSPRRWGRHSSNFQNYDGMPRDSKDNTYFLSEVGPIIKVSSGNVVHVTDISNLAFEGWADIAIDSQDNLYVINNYGQVAKITPNGKSSLLATLEDFIVFPEDYPGWGWGNIDTDSADNVYVLNLSYGKIIKITPSGTVTEFANISQFSSNPNNGQWQQFEVTDDGTIFVLNSSNDKLVVKITRDGVATKFADLPDLSGNGWINFAIDHIGNLYVQDFITMLKITPDGVVAPFASSTGYGLSVDRGGNLYGFSNSVKKIAPDGTDISVVNSVPNTFSPPPFSAPIYNGEPDSDDVSGLDDNCPFIWNPSQGDVDGDGVGNVCDTLPEHANAKQKSAVVPTMGSVVDETTLVVSNDEFSGTVHTPLSAPDVKYTVTSATSPYLGIEIDGVAIIPRSILKEGNQYAMEFNTTLSADASASLADADASELAGAQVANIVRAVPGLSYTAAGVVEYVNGAHTLCVLSFWGNKVGDCKPIKNKISQTIFGYGTFSASAGFAPFVSMRQSITKWLSPLFALK